MGHVYLPRKGGVGEFDPVFDNVPLNPLPLDFIGNTNGYGGAIRSIAIDNDFIYAGGTTNQTVQKFTKQGPGIENGIIVFDSNNYIREDLV